MNNQFVVSFAAAAMAAVPAHAATSETAPRVAGIAIGTLAADAPAQVKIYDAGGGFHAGLLPFGASKDFNGGVWVGGGDINGDGRADLVAGHASGPLVKAFDGNGLRPHLSFEPYSAEFRGGVFVAAGDVNGDGLADIVTGAGPGAGPHVRAFDGSAQPLRSFFAFGPGFQGGVRVAAGDVNGDGVADIIAGAGPGAGPRVRVFDGLTLQVLHDFDAFDAQFQGGVFVATGNFDGDRSLFVSTALGDGSVRVFSLADMSLKTSFLAFDPSFKGGVTLGFTSDGRTDRLVVGQASQGGLVGVFDVSKGIGADGPATALTAPGTPFYLAPFGRDYLGGVSVAGLGALAVPEPQSWALMIAGFAGAGLAARRKQRAATT